MERKQPRWEKGQSLLHKESREGFWQENVFGKMEYVKEERKGKEKKGFVMKAKESPGTPLHREKEKHLELDKVKKVKMKRERFLYASGAPFRNQAIFYQVTEWERSQEFLQCIKDMMKEYGHRTLEEAFGFLDQGPERGEKRELMKEQRGQLSLEEFCSLNHDLEIVESRIRKKEAKERQMCGELQLMIDREKEQRKKRKTSDSISGRHNSFLLQEAEGKGKQNGAEEGKQNSEEESKGKQNSEEEGKGKRNGAEEGKQNSEEEGKGKQGRLAEESREEEEAAKK